MKYCFLIALFFSSNLAFSQKPSDEKIFSFIIDSIFKIHKLPFYKDTLIHEETNSLYSQLKDTITFIHPETYEEERMTGLELLIRYDSINLQEAMFFRERLNFPDGLILICKRSKSSFHHYDTSKLKKDIILDSYPNLSELPELTDSIFNLKKISNFHIFPCSKENNNKYKYTAKAFFLTSGVLWDVTTTYCVVECGIHYRDNRGAVTGHGGLAFFEYKNNQLKFIKGIGLWEE